MPRHNRSKFPRIRPALYGLILASAWSFGTARADVFFSEYIEGSSNNKALEIYNSGDSAVDLSAYEVQVFFNGSATAGLTIPLQGTLAPGAVHVLAQGLANADILAQADQISSAGWFNGDDAVALSFSGIAVDVIGQIGVDPGSQWGTGDLATANRTLRRKSHVTSGDVDGFDNFDPGVEWLGFPQDAVDDLGSRTGGDPDPEPPAHGECGAAATRIHIVQGGGAATSLAGTAQTIEGIVVGDFQGAEQLGGFFVQEEDAERDGDPSTSEGIFVFQGSLTAAVAAGDKVRITGTASEYFEMTQISATQITVCGSGFTVTPTLLPLPVSALAELEVMEGMAVTAQGLTVTENYNLGRYGEMVLSAGGRLFNPTQIAEPGVPAQALAEANRLRRILLDDGSSRQNPASIAYPPPQLTADNTVRSGDAVEQLRGVLHYAFSEYRIQPTAPVLFAAANPRSATPGSAAGGSLKIASFNVLNYFNGDGLGGGFPTSRGANTPAEFQKQRTKILAALVALDADIVGLIEIENDGYGPQSAVADLVAGLAQAGLQYAVVDPGRPRIGTDEITVGFIYKPATVALAGASALLDSAVDPTFIDTKNRPVLAQSFRETASGAVFTAAVAHLKSKGSDCLDVNDPDTGDGQGNCNQTRTAAAAAMAAWLSEDPTASGDPDRLLLGDLNSYAKEDPIRALEAAGFINLLRDRHGDTPYSYVFEGQAGYLDHALASASLRAQVNGVGEWHINADEPRILDYNEEFKTPEQIGQLYSPEAWRSSDHDPLLVQLDLDAPPPPPVPGDFNGDRLLNAADLALLAQQLGKPLTAANQHFDLNRDGRILFGELLLWSKWYLAGRKP